MFIINISEIKKSGILESERRKKKENDRNTMYTTIKSELMYNAPTIQYIQTIYLSKTDTTITKYISILICILVIINGCYLKN